MGEQQQDHHYRKRESQKKPSENQSANSARRTGFIAAGCTASAILLILIVSLIFPVLFPGILPGVRIDTIKVGGMRHGEAVSAITAKINMQADEPLIVTTPSTEFSAPLGTLIESHNIAETVDQAYAIGRSGSAFQRIGDFFHALFGKIDLGIELIEKREGIQQLVDNVAASVDDPGKIPTFTPDEKKGEMIIYSGVPGKAINQDVLYDAIYEKLAHFDDTSLSASISVLPVEINWDEVYPRICPEKKDAYVETGENGNYRIVPEVVGLSFDVERARTEIVPGDGKTYTFPLTVDRPKVTKAELAKTVFTDVLTTRTTKLNPNEVDRTHNVRISAQYLNGAIIQPGEVFSFNKRVGKRTAERGYREAKIYANGEVVDGLGGGLCQVSSTLYSALLRTNSDDFKIVERHNHMFTVGYVPLGEDATLYWNSLDFRFQNKTAYPVMIKAWQSGSSVTVQVVGTKTRETKETIKVVSNLLSTTPFSEIKREDNTKAPGYEKVQQGGSNGKLVETVKIYYDANGKEIRREYVDQSNYKPAARIIIVGPSIPGKPDIPVGPVDPSKPTDPTVPTNPTTPTDPTNPTDPTSPPVTPEEPNLPTDPTPKPEPPIETELLPS